MLKSEKGLLGKKSEYFIAYEDYSSYRLLNINIIISEEVAGAGIVTEICDLLKSKDVLVLFGLAFGGSKFQYSALQSELKKLKGFDIPLSIMLYGKSERLSIQLVCADSKNVSSVTGDSYIKILTGESLKLIYLNALRCDKKGLSRAEETAGIFNSLELSLRKNKLTAQSLIRTWLYLDNILEWYDEFNAARSLYFDEHRIFDRLIPASTGIGAGNSFSKSIVMSGIAIDPDNSIKVESVESPLQCAATDYKSSFSRAIKVSTDGYKKLMVSGTASILPDGKTAFKGKPADQVIKTFQVIQAILKKEGMDFADVSRAIAYFPDSSTMHVFNQYCVEYNLNSDVVLKVEADICRDDLLFEMELDAFSGKQSS